MVLTEYERETLKLIPLMPKMDAASQNRIRKRVDGLRASSPAFDAAFGRTLSRMDVTEKPKKEKSFLRTVAEVVSHPVETAKGKVGEALLKRRNEAPEILVHPHPDLAKVAEPWDFEKESKEDLIAIVRQLGAALRKVSYGDRLGMAAPQIGISKRVFVCQGAVCVNPSFETPKVVETVEMLEGCYSLPEKQIWKTKRAKYGWAKFYSVDGAERKYKIHGLDAIVFQHELDHLNGLCACDIGVLYTPEEHAKS